MFATLLIVAACGFGLAAVLYLTRLVQYQSGPPRAANWVMGSATGVMIVIAVLALTGAEGAELAAAPQVLLLVSIALALMGLLSQAAGHYAPAAPVAASMVAVIALVLFFKLTEGVPAGSAAGLKTVTVIHISATVIGFLLFVPAYVLSILFLGQSYRLKTKQQANTSLPSLLSMEQSAWRLLYIGFPLYTVGILLGAVWAESASSLSLDGVMRPRQLFAAASWCIFAYAIVRRLKTGWRGVRAAVTVMGAFVITLGAVLLYMMR